MSYGLTDDVLCRAMGPAPGRFLLALIARCVNKRDGYARPSLRYLVERSGYSRRTVVHYITYLKAVGALIVTERPGRPSEYRIADPTRAGAALVSDAPPVQELHAGGGAGAAPEPIRNQEKNPPHAPTARRRRAHALRRGAASPSRPRPDGLEDGPVAGPAGGRGRRGDPRIPTLIAAFVSLHAEALGQAYLVHGGRDGAHLKRALKTYGEDQITVAMESYFADRKGWRSFPPSIPHFIGRVALLLSAARPAAPEPDFDAARKIRDRLARGAS
jgi:hypothetical protein